MEGLRVLLISIYFLCFIASAYCQTDRIQSPKMQPSSTPSQNPPVSPKSQPEDLKGIKPALQSSLNIINFSTSSNTINYGDEVTLRWTINGYNVSNLRLEIKPDVGIIPLSRTDYRNENFTIEGSKTIKPFKSETYTLQIIASDPVKLDFDKYGRPQQSMLQKSKVVSINVKKPRIENMKPLVDQKTMKIKFLVKNIGDGDFVSSPIEVAYAVINNLSGPSLASGRFTTPNLTIKAGEQVQLGEITLFEKERALSGSGIMINVSIEPKYRMPLEKDVDYYEHTWETEKFIINNELIAIFGGLISGSIRLNNYFGTECGAGTPTHSDTPYTQKRQRLTEDSYPCTPGDPYFKKNDCYIEIMNNRQNFSLPRFEYTKGSLITYDYKGYVHDLNAKWDGKTAFSVSKGKLKFEINFETEGTEIKGYEYTQGLYYDWSAPDYDLTKFNFTIYFKFGLRNKRLSYIDIEISPEVSGRFVGGYKILPDSLERDVDEKIKNEISRRLKELLMSDNIRGKIEEAINSRINSLLKIYRIVDVKSEGDNILIEYLPK